MEGHLYTRGKSKVWYLLYDLPIKPGENRNQRSVRIGRMSERKAQERQREFLRNIDEGTWVEDRDLTVRDLLTTWLADNEHRVTAKTWEVYDARVRLHLIPTLGSIKLAKLSPKHLIDAYAAIRAKGLSPQTCVHIHRVLHTALSYGLRTLRVVKQNVCDSVPPLETPPKRNLAALSESQVCTIMEAAKGTPLETPVVTAALTGLRRSELLALRWSTSIDLERGRLIVNDVLEHSRRFGVRFKPKAKSKSSQRVVPLAPELVQILTVHKLHQEEARKNLEPSYVDYDLVFCNPDGSPWPPDTFTRQFTRIARLVGLDGVFRFHDARHAFASITLKNGVSVKEVSALLGHSSPMLTLSTYAHVMEGMGREAVNGLAKSLLVTRKVESFR